MQRWIYELVENHLNEVDTQCNSDIENVRNELKYKYINVHFIISLITGICSHVTTILYNNTVFYSLPSMLMIVLNYNY